MRFLRMKNPVVFSPGQNATVELLLIPAKPWIEDIAQGIAKYIR